MERVLESTQRKLDDHYTKKRTINTERQVEQLKRNVDAYKKQIEELRRELTPKVREIFPEPQEEEENAKNTTSIELDSDHIV